MRDRAAENPRRRFGRLSRSGSRAQDSDIDLVLLVTDPRGFRADTTWIEQIDWQELDSRPQSWQDEDYGVAWSRRI